MKVHNYDLPLAILFALILAGNVRAAAQPDFNGEWKLNLAKSHFGERAAPIGSIMKIEHKDPVLRVTRTLTTGNGELTTETAYRTDSKQTTNKLPGGGEMKSTGKWEGSALLIATPIILNGNKLAIKWQWTLSQDGKTLTTVRTLPNRDGTQTEVFERK